MAAAAMLDECEMLYSEDMQDGLVVENTLTIRDRFANASA